MTCVAELPQLDKLKAREEELGFKLYGLEVKGLLGKMRDVVKEKKTTFPILLDDRRFARNDLHVLGTPTTFVIDKDGRVRARLIGGAENIDKIIGDVLVRVSVSGK